jgi:hypothetical protein
MEQIIYHHQKPHSHQTIKTWTSSWLLAINHFARKKKKSDVKPQDPELNLLVIQRSIRYVGGFDNPAFDDLTMYDGDLQYDFL